MAQKSVSPPFQIVAPTSVSGTQVITGSVTTVLYRDSLSYQFNLSGPVTGTIEIQASNDYSPGYPQTAGNSGAENSGNWVTIPVQNSAGAITTSISVSSGSAQPVMLNLSDLGFSYARPVFTNTSSSGTVTVYVSAKSFGG